MLSHFVPLIQQYGLIGIFISVAIESLGIPLPTEPAYIVGQSFITSGTHPAWLIHVVLYFGHMIGALISYFAGRHISKEFLKKKREYTDTQRKLAGWYGKYGAVTVFGTRLIGYVRPWTSYVAGIAEVKFWPFFIFTSLATIILNACSLFFSATFLKIWEEYPFMRSIIVISLGAGFAFLLLQTARKKFGHKPSVPLS